MCGCARRYEAALQQLQEDQRQIDRRVARGGFRSKDRDMALQVRAAVWQRVSRVVGVSVCWLPGPSMHFCA
jgi:hypothetical protein